ncbi:MAG: hypothetical protein VX340_09155 [Pseudomonadota bacterium]|nr:hypothetical protein [Pseudomonadota bacterium]
MAQLYIAVIYGDSLGVPRNEVQAAAWFRKAADQGHVATKIILARMNEQSWGVDQDLSRAQHWYAEAAAQGDDEAIRKLRELGG